jgi:polyhydroxyalkanoate synthesis regulator phasin
LISWKNSFKEISKDLELTRKKKQALDDLFNEGRISESTYESLNKEITDTIMDIEARRKALAEKVTSKINELEQQITVLEMFLASSEIGYVAGEINEELHQRESNAFALGLEATRQELNAVKEVVGNLVPEEPAPMPPSPLTEATEEPQTGELVEEPPEITVEAPPEPEAITEEIPSEQLMETPAEKPFVEESAEMPYEAPPEVLPEEVSPEEEEEFQQSEETIEEVVEETVEEAMETSEAPDETALEEASTEEEATTEEEYSE